MFLCFLGIERNDKNTYAHRYCHRRVFIVLTSFKTLNIISYFYSVTVIDAFISGISWKGISSITSVMHVYLLREGAL